MTGLDDYGETWYSRLVIMLQAVLVLAAIGIGAMWFLVEPWSTRVFQGAFWLALLAGLEALGLVSAIWRALPILVLLGLVFLFGQVAVQERYQEPFVFWPIVLSVWFVMSNHDLGRWCGQKWTAYQTRRQAAQARTIDRQPVVSRSRQELEARMERREQERREQEKTSRRVGFDDDYEY